MRKVLVIAFAFVMAVPALARDTGHMFDIQEALAANDAQNRLGDEVKFYFGDQAHPGVARTISEVVANRKTNAFGKGDLEACQWVFLSSMLALRDAALERGADAVVNIESYYDREAVSDAESYECHAGNVVAGVALKGDLVKLK
ncbi:excinuclease ATPase subunit [Proteobacteria bacterium 005FR1]|nr:excinuclease ATPase subunit [Proteobacteria bacterium 005FR1]